MAKTLTSQPHLLPNSGATLLTPGDGLHARVVHDLVTDINNLWGYVAMPVGYCQGPEGNFAVDVASTSSTEFYVEQVPTLVPEGSVRLLSTMGVKAYATTSKTTTVSAINVYMSSRPYLGPAYPFDVTYLANDYTSSAISAGLLVTASTTTYALKTDTTTGVTPLRSVSSDGANRMAYVVLTATGYGNGTYGNDDNFLYVHDFTWWIPKE